MQRYYITINSVPHTVHLIPVLHLFCNWKFVPLNLPHIFLSSLRFTLETAQVPFSLLFSHSVISDSFETPWSVAYQASLSFSISQSLLKLMSIELMMPSNHLILCGPLLLLLSIFPSIRGFFLQWASSLHQVAKVLELLHQSLQWIFRVYFL